MLEPNYDGEMPLLKLKTAGDFGIGTFHALEGELVVNKGNFYHCIDGKANMARDDSLIAWASFYDFGNPISYCSGISFDSTELFILQNGFCQSNGFVGITIKGIFKVLKLTSTPKQKKPYPTIDEVIRQCKNYYFSAIKGTAVGCYIPKALSTIQKPGIHLHFISEDESIGGHVLDFYTEISEIHLERISKLLLEI